MIDFLSDDESLLLTVSEGRGKFGPRASAFLNLLTDWKEGIYSVKREVERRNHLLCSLILPRRGGLDGQRVFRRRW